MLLYLKGVEYILRRSGGGYRGSSEPRQMYKAICSECGAECEVPFKPAEGRPVYCRECFAKRRR
ncbi:MAG: DNA-directed RNA polymerase [Candidatus Odinarchaeum yellowstonii]|uniref:DNA-directed RNA polymerase n=1 Tax=Odinarchaeota yellowstonii (strain LCB_4) TaxID=1841599 RepID=A0AAF0IBZ3_ODILC|nr:MAG: DNA-directed RNA polymerase [Candidatus Odinarchaeum yellowstonii]